MMSVTPGTRMPTWILTASPRTCRRPATMPLGAGWWAGGGLGGGPGGGPGGGDQRRMRYAAAAVTPNTASVLQALLGAGPAGLAELARETNALVPQLLQVDLLRGGRVVAVTVDFPDPALVTQIINTNFDMPACHTTV